MSAQTPKVEFQVASIKRTEELDRSIRPLPGGRLRAVATLRFLIEKAFNVPAVEIMGGPAWTESECYQIEAKAEGNPSTDQLFTMLQSLLEDRFQLKTHRQTKELPLYILLPAKNGPKLPAPKESNCWPEDAPPPPPGAQPNGARRLASFLNVGGSLVDLEISRECYRAVVLRCLS
jgi:uncharacterized protein (TIGR03435 family)